MQTMEDMIYKKRKFSSSLTLDTEQLNKPHTQKFSAMSSQRYFFGFLHSVARHGRMDVME